MNIKSHAESSRFLSGIFAQNMIDSLKKQRGLNEKNKLQLLTDIGTLKNIIQPLIFEKLNERRRS